MYRAADRLNPDRYRRLTRAVYAEMAPYVNHEPIETAVLVNGDEIQIGKFRLVFLTRPTTG